MENAQITVTFANGEVHTNLPAQAHTIEVVMADDEVVAGVVYATLPVYSDAHGRPHREVYAFFVRPDGSASRTIRASNPAFPADTDELPELLASLGRFLVSA